MRKIACVVLFLCLFTFVTIFPANTKAAEGVLEEIKQFAQTHGIELFKTSASSDTEGFGFSDANELNQIQLGEGFPVYLVDYAKLKKNPTSNQLTAQLKQTDAWRFFVNVHEQPKSFLTVGYQNGNLTVIEYGGKSVGLGEAYELVKKTNPENIILVEDEGVKYFITKKNNQEFVIPDTREKTERTNGMDNKQMWPSKKLIDKIRTAPILDENYVDGGTISGSGIGTYTNSPSILHILFISIGVALGGTILFVIARRRRAQ